MNHHRFAALAAVVLVSLFTIINPPTINANGGPEQDVLTDAMVQAVVNQQAAINRAAGYDVVFTATDVDRGLQSALLDDAAGLSVFEKPTKISEKDVYFSAAGIRVTPSGVTQFIGVSSNPFEGGVVMFHAYHRALDGSFVEDIHQDTGLRGNSAEMVAKEDWNGDGFVDTLIGVAAPATGADWDSTFSVAWSTGEIKTYKFPGDKIYGLSAWPGGVVSPNWGEGWVTVYYYNGQLGFNRVIIPCPLAGWNHAVIGDVDGDGKYDLGALSGQSIAPAYFYLFLGQSDGTFSEVPISFPTQIPAGMGLPTTVAFGKIGVNRSQPLADDIIIGFQGLVHPDWKGEEPVLHIYRTHPGEYAPSWSYMAMNEDSEQVVIYDVNHLEGNEIIVTVAGSASFMWWDEVHQTWVDEWLGPRPTHLDPQGVMMTEYGLLITGYYGLVLVPFADQVIEPTAEPTQAIPTVEPTGVPTVEPAPTPWPTPYADPGTRKGEKLYLPLGLNKGF